MKLLRGLAGHPLHPPLTDVTIGAYTFATAMALLSRVGVSEHNTATAWWLGLIVALVVTVPTATAGFADWLTIPPETPLWRTATLHLSAMLTATVVFAIAAGAGHADYVDGTVGGGSLVLTLVGFVLLTIGGWLGGAIVFTYGMRVLKLVDEPTSRAISPLPLPEKEEAEV
ncbi:MAG TPA: DUF2231 domain-containing protein [Gaiellaceae bacterium]|nr:DUF2231 domain-containing protein [Gaiellaceae bacterium]